MTLNPALYAVLRKHFGPVRISNPGQVRIESRDGKTDYSVLDRGEHYNINCPLCRDTQGRLSICYKWLTQAATNHRITGLAHCYKESCPVTEKAFWEPLLEDLEDAELGALLTPDAPGVIVAQPTRAAPAVRLPMGYTRLADLPDDHPAVEFARTKYAIPVKYMSDGYEVGYTEQPDPIYSLAQYRLIFPIRKNGNLVAWQGRTTTGAAPRWWLTMGFVKTLYNAERVRPEETPVLCEGIPSAIASGPQGLCIFGKVLTKPQLQEIADKWMNVIIATDPETYAPDNRPGQNGKVYALEMRNALRAVGVGATLLPWPEDLLALARRHNEGEKVPVPDAADIGIKRMYQLVQEARCQTTI
jgi:hypothetical protein